MGKTMSPEERRQFERKVMEVFKDELKMLSRELQEILVDDLVTAFQNRMKVFARFQSERIR